MGATSFSAKSRKRSRNICCSSVRAKSMDFFSFRKWYVRRAKLAGHTIFGFIVYLIWAGRGAGRMAAVVAALELAQLGFQLLVLLAQLGVFRFQRARFVR